MNTKTEISPVVTARQLRKELAQAFPGTKFRVTSSRSFNGGVLTVEWTDGETSDRVREIAEKYRGIVTHFNAYTDCYDAPTYNLLADGSYYGVSSVHLQRAISDATYASIAGTALKMSGVNSMDEFTEIIRKDTVPNALYTRFYDRTKGQGIPHMNDAHDFIRWAFNQMDFTNSELTDLVA